MNVSSIGASGNRPGAAPVQRRPPDLKDAPAPLPEETVARHLASLDDALETGDLDRARVSLTAVRKAAELPEEDSLGFADPLSGISKALRSGDIESARSAWNDFRTEIEGDEPAPEAIFSITETSTFSILA